TRLFQTNVSESTPVGSFILQVTSLDRDEGNNSQVTYSLLTDTDRFRIDAQTGNLYLAGQLDREEQEEYFLSVSANDGSWRAQTTVTLYILDENDNTPQFDQAAYQFDVDLSSGDLTNRTIGRVQAS